MWSVFLKKYLEHLKTSNRESLGKTFRSPLKCIYYPEFGIYVFYMYCLIFTKTYEVDCYYLCFRGEETEIWVSCLGSRDAWNQNLNRQAISKTNALNHFPILPPTFILCFQHSLFCHLRFEKSLSNGHYYYYSDVSQSTSSSTCPECSLCSLQLPRLTSFSYVLHLMKWSHYLVSRTTSSHSITTSSQPPGPIICAYEK